MRFVLRPAFQLIFATICFVMELGVGFAGAAEPLPYAADFEPPVYELEQEPQNGWQAGSPALAAVQDRQAMDGQAALEMQPGGFADQSFQSDDSTVWVDSFFTGNPSDTLPDFSKLNKGAAIVAVTSDRGVLCLDGAGDGSGGTWLESGIAVHDNSWIRITLKLDFTARRYDVYLNGSLIFSDLGFLYNDTPRLNGLRAQSGNRFGYLDNLRVQPEMPGDLGLAPECSPAAIENYLLGLEKDPTGLDVNRDGRIDIADFIQCMPDS